jgi:hypothetical protein
MLRISHCLDSRLTDGGEVVRRLNIPQALVRLEGLGKLKKKNNDLIGNLTYDLSGCNIVPQLYATACPLVIRNGTLNSK